MEQETDLAYPNAPEELKNETIIDRFMEALPPVSRDRLQPVMTMYKTPIEVAVAAEAEKTYLSKTGRLDGKTIKCGQVNTQNINNSQNNGNNGNSNTQGSGNNNNSGNQQNNGNRKSRSKF